jgi:O-antigen ligase
MNASKVSRLLFAAGAVLVVLAAAPYPVFDLDRFFVPKELVLHAFALALALLALRGARGLDLSGEDLALAAYLALSAAGALFAGDHWLSSRALAVTLSGAAVFWAARSAAGGGARRFIVTAAAAAAVLGAAASLAQAYGLTSGLFSAHRVPGGTLGNRNFMAHLAVICLPALLLATLAARRSLAALAGAAGLGVLAAALVLSRTRAAYLGLAAGAAVAAYGLWRARGRWNSAEAGFRLKALALAAALGVLAALLLPNKLEWKSGSPYLDTVTGMVNYRKGSGRGRLLQYSRTLRMAAGHPLLGVGPGNWTAAYPKLAARYDYDPSISYATGATLNPWPSSDWMAIVSERGLPALLALLLLFWALLRGAWRRAAKAAAPEEYMESLALAATVAVTAVVCCFDAVLLLAAPTFIAWALFGALASAGAPVRSVPLTPGLRRRLALAVALFGAAAVLRSAGQLAAMSLYGRARTAAQFRTASLLDPGNARIWARYLNLLERGKRAPSAGAEQELAATAAETEAAAPAEGDEVTLSTVPSAGN